MRHTPFWTRRRSLHGSWRRVEGAAECKDSDQHKIRTLTKANNNSKNGDDQDDVVRADAGGRRRTSKRLSGRYGIVGRSSWAERKGPIDVCFLPRYESEVVLRNNVMLMISLSSPAADAFRISGLPIASTIRQCWQTCRIWRKLQDGDPDSRRPSPHPSEFLCYVAMASRRNLRWLTRVSTRR
jgi:hypothetical protein